MSARRWRQVDGLLLLDKPRGISSNAALQRARRALEAAKAGHTGTLDPLASGLLPLCFGEATKFAQFLLDAGKRYRATVRFGVVTDTLDAEGQVMATHPVDLDESAIAGALAAMIGPRRQVPPMHSALKHEGRPLYAYARAGEEAPRVARAIVVDTLTLVSWETPDAVVDVACSKGTYVRVLAAELGEAMGCGAHLAGLRRTASGAFEIADATALDTLEELPAAARHALLRPVDAMVAHLPAAHLTAEQADDLQRGRTVQAAGWADALYRCYAADRFLGIAAARDGVMAAQRLLRESSA